MMEANFYGSIYINALLGLLLASAMIMIAVEERYDKSFILRMVLVFSFITLAKQICLTFVILCLLYLLIILI